MTIKKKEEGGRYPVFKSHFLGLELELEKGLSPQEANEQGAKATPGLFVKFGAEANQRSDIYDPNIDSRLTTDKEREHIVSLMMNRDEFGAADGYKTYDPGAEPISTTQDEIDAEVDAEVERRLAERMAETAVANAEK